MLYESYVHLLTILSTLPSTAFGALLALWLTKTQFTLVTTIACILLVGMVMKNAIMMIDYAVDAERHQNLSAQQAIVLAVRLRARPITMTMLAAFFSAVPIAIGTGPGFEIRQPLGITVMGGLIVAQLFTLYSTPVAYLIMDRLRCRKSATAGEARGDSRDRPQRTIDRSTTNLQPRSYLNRTRANRRPRIWPHGILDPQLVNWPEPEIGHSTENIRLGTFLFHDWLVRNQ